MSENKSANDLIRQKLLDMFSLSLKTTIETDPWNGAGYEVTQDSIDTETFEKEIVPQIMSIFESYQEIITDLELKLQKKNSDIAADKFGWH